MTLVAAAVPIPVATFRVPLGTGVFGGSPFATIGFDPDIDLNAAFAFDPQAGRSAPDLPGLPGCDQADHGKDRKHDPRDLIRRLNDEGRQKGGHDCKGKAKDELYHGFGIADGFGGTVAVPSLTGFCGEVSE